MTAANIEPFQRTPGGDLEINVDIRDEWPGLAVLRLRGAITPRAVPVLQEIFSCDRHFIWV